MYATTDPVAMDTYGAMLVDKYRLDKGIKSLKDAKREASYIRVASDLGLGVGNLNDIRLREITI